VNASHNQFTLVSSKVGPDILNQTFTIVPTHIAIEVERDVVCHTTDATAGCMNTDVVAVAGKVELKICCHSYGASYTPFLRWVVKNLLP
jgi:hypothetical protein